MAARKRYKPLATVGAYKAALAMLDEGLPPRHRRMLASHYNAPKRTITARSLAAAVGYPNFNSVNLQYGTLARKICEILGLRLEFHVSVLAEFIMPKPEDGTEVLWVMRPELSRALEELQWV
jgi:hypothetical protein